MLPFQMKYVEFALYHTLKCRKISNYQLLTWQMEYSIDPDKSNAHLLELFFVSPQSSS